MLKQEHALAHTVACPHTVEVPGKDILYPRPAVSFHEGMHVSRFLSHTNTTTQSTFFIIREYTASVVSARSSCVCLCLCVFPDKVNDPVMAVQIAWMMDVPQLYRQCYDKPPKLQTNATGYKHPSLNVPTL